MGDAAISLIAIGLAAVAIYLIVMQLIAVAIRRRQGRSATFIPFLPAILGVAACMLAPWPWSRWLIPVFVLGDPSVVMLAVAIARGTFKQR